MLIKSFWGPSAASPAHTAGSAARVRETLRVAENRISGNQASLPTSRTNFEKPGVAMVLQVVTGKPLPRSPRTQGSPRCLGSGILERSHFIRPLSGVGCGEIPYLGCHCGFPSTSSKTHSQFLIKPLSGGKALGWGLDIFDTKGLCPLGLYFRGARDTDEIGERDCGMLSAWIWKVLRWRIERPLSVPWAGRWPSQRR